MGADDIHVPPAADSPAEAPAAQAAADLAPQLDEDTPDTTAAGDHLATGGSLIEVSASPADLDEDTPATDAVAEQAESSRWLMQLHVEGPKSQFGDAKDPDGIRSDSYWLPLDDLATDDPRLANGTWGDLCDRLQIADDDGLRGVFPAGQQVKQWDLVAAEHALPPEWGARTQVSFARVPDDINIAATAVNPVPYAPWSAAGEIRSFPEALPPDPAAPGLAEADSRATFSYNDIVVPMGNELHTEQFDSSWIHGTPHEVPELADRVLADASAAGGTDPVSTLINLAGAKSDQQYRIRDGVVVADEAGNPVDFDRRWRDQVPVYDADGQIVTDQAKVPVWRSLADVPLPADDDGV